MASIAQAFFPPLRRVLRHGGRGWPVASGRAHHLIQAIEVDRVPLRSIAPAEVEVLADQQPLVLEAEEGFLDGAEAPEGEVVFLPLAVGVVDPAAAVAALRLAIIA